MIRSRQSTRQLPTRVEISAGIECINCAVCYAACDTVAGNSDYFDPAALQRAWGVYNDSKDGGKQAALDAVSGAGIKRESARTYFKGAKHDTPALYGKADFGAGNDTAGADADRCDDLRNPRRVISS